MKQETRIYPLHQWPKIYVDYVNNFMTMRTWAEYYGMSPEYAHNVLNAGRLTDNFSKPLVWPETGEDA